MDRVKSASACSQLIPLVAGDAAHVVRKRVAWVETDCLIAIGDGLIELSFCKVDLARAQCAVARVGSSRIASVASASAISSWPIRSLTMPRPRCAFALFGSRRMASS